METNLTVTTPSGTNTANVSVKLTDISKRYKLYLDKKDRLKEAIHPFKKKYHKDFYALKDINLEVKKGEILGIVGRNGSGKSTLLKIISGILTPTNGNVQTAGNVVALLELGAGFNPEFTGYDNIYFYCSILGYSRQESDEIVESVIEFAEIGDYIHQPLKTYSSGMKARLAFAVSINVDPDILILDEVLSVGDELFRRKCYAKMEDFFKGGKTILFVSHSISSINQMCSQAILLDRGEFLIQGSTNLVTEYYQKYLYTKKENREIVRKEIIEIYKNEEFKKKYKPQEPASGKSANRQSTADKSKDELTCNDIAVNDNAIFNQEKQSAFYIPNFKPKTTQEIKNEDVNISDIEIKTVNNQKVNALVLHDEYILSYKVQFNTRARNVFFGYAIKNEKGLCINSGYTWKDPIGEVKNGAQYLVDWRFSCLLLPGIYYVNIVANQDTEGGLNILARIVDAIVFKVISDVNKVKRTIGGMVSINQHPTISLLK